MHRTLHIRGEEKSLIYISPQKTAVPANLLQGRKEAGWIYRNGNLEEWVWQGFAQHEGARYIYFDAQPLQPLETLFSMSGERAIAHLIEIGALFDLLRVDRFIPEDALYLLEGGGVLMLPPSIIELQVTGKTEQILYDTHEKWVRPGFRGPAAAVYQLSSLLYRIIGGSAPLDDQEARDDGYRPIPLQLLNTKLPDDAAGWLGAILNARKAQDLPAIEQWLASLKLHSETLIAAARSSPSPSPQLDQFLTRRAKRVGRIRFLRKRGTLLIVSIAALAVVLTIAVPMVTRALQPPATAGLSPEQMLGVYYESQNTLDSVLLEDCLARGVKSDASNLVTYLFVTSRTRLAYEQTDGIIRAEEWIAEGMPEIPEGYFVYGIVNLEIVQLDADTFIAEYDMWLPQSADENEVTSQTGSAGMHIVEELDVRAVKDWWVITEIREISRESLPR